MMFSCFEGKLPYTVHWHVNSFYLFSPSVYLVVFRNTSSFGGKIMSLGKKTMQPKLPLLMLFSIFCIILLQPSSKCPDPCICPIWKFLKVKVAQSCLTLCYPMDCIVACQAPPSMGFSRQEYWSGLQFPSLGDLPDPGIEPWSPALESASLPAELPGNPSQT